MAEQEDKELRAMQKVIESLEGLEAEARTRVLEYVFRRLGIAWQSTSAGAKTGLVPPPVPLEAAERPAGVVGLTRPDIRSLKEMKQPRSANQMAALVAFYLSELAPSDERRESIGTADLTKYFKQAGFKLPQRLDATLANATNAGYLDSAGDGKYKLNPVGYNLVAYSLPSGGAPKKPAKKPNVKKKGSPKRA